MIKKTVLLYCLNFYPEVIGVGKYNYEIADFLSEEKNNLNVIVITGIPHYPKRKLFAKYKFLYSKEIVSNYVVYRCPIIQLDTFGLIGKIISNLSFLIFSIPILLKFLFKPPSVILQICPTIIVSPVIILFSKVRKIKTVLHVQDLEINALQNLLHKKYRFLLNSLYFFEYKLINCFDYVSTITPNMVIEINKKGIDLKKIKLIPNWGDDNILLGRKLLKDFKSSLNFKESDKIIFYSGNIGRKQGLNYLLEAAYELKYNPNIKFIIAGDGTEKNKLIKLKDKLSLSNLTFLDILPKDTYKKYLQIADCHFVSQLDNLNNSFFPSKLTNIIANGGSIVILCQSQSELAKFAIQNSKFCQFVDIKNPTNLSFEILKNINNSRPNKFAIEYSENNLKKEKIINKFIDLFDE